MNIYSSRKPARWSSFDLLEKEKSSFDGEMLHVETSKMAGNSVQNSLPSLPDEPHNLDYFPFFKQCIGKLKLVL